MVITRATDYSIRAVLHMAEKYGAQVVSKQEICEAESITPAFLTKILQPLIHCGIVRSKRGVAGGFALAKDPNEITLYDIMQAVEEPMTMNVCLVNGHSCDREEVCPVHQLWSESKGMLENTFSRRSIADLAQEQFKKKMVLSKPMVETPRIAAQATI